LLPQTDGKTDRLTVTLFLSKCNNSRSTDAIEMKLQIRIELKWVKILTLASIFWELFPFVNGHTFLSKCNNSSLTDAIEMKLHIWIELKRVKSHAQDS